MKPWMTDEAKRDFPTLDRALFRLMFEADKHLKILPELKLGAHEDCFRMVCKAIRAGLDDDNLPRHLPAKIMEICHDHVQMAQRELSHDWNAIFLYNTWKMLEHAAVVLHGACGHALIISDQDGTMTTEKNTTVLYGLTGVMVQANMIRHCALNPETTWKTLDAGKINSLQDIPGLEVLTESRPQWIVDLLDEGIPDGVKKLSEHCFLGEAHIMRKKPPSLETRH